LKTKTDFIALYKKMSFHSASEEDDYCFEARFWVFEGLLL